MTLFEGRNLDCRRGGRDVFAGLSFELPAGGALLLTGANGSGKSSLLRMLAGLLRPAGGAILWDGQPVGEDPGAHAARLHYLGHLDAVKPVLSVRENLRFWASLREGAEGQGAEGDGATAEDAGGGEAVPDDSVLGESGRLEAALDHFALGDLADVAGRLLSAGQRRRLALARLLAQPAALWLLDEPSVGLDHASVGRLAAAIAGHRARGGSVIVATHTALDLPDALPLSLDALAPPPLPEMIW
ncbi:heme ABC exporter ATP-binding protein CcmA [Pelagibius sp.]|uniref:ABC transporter ATP-binding protein n=1 Tax=Pelagibius sp. TaxID=1931238 RepID=UPI00261D1884|nr:heme ABC exporter ATP-binding protein CcmA [Pelagibius sp.]